MFVLFPVLFCIRPNTERTLCLPARVARPCLAKTAGRAARFSLAAQRSWVQDVFPRMLTCAAGAVEPRAVRRLEKIEENTAKKILENAG